MSKKCSKNGDNDSGHDGDAPQKAEHKLEQFTIERGIGSPRKPLNNEVGGEPVTTTLRRLCWRQPLIAKPSGELIACNTLLKAAHKHSLTIVPVVWFEDTDLEATAYSIADNRTHEFSEWDEPALS